MRLYPLKETMRYSELKRTIYSNKAAVSRFARFETFRWV